MKFEKHIEKPQDFRPLTDYESKLLHKLLEHQFAGVEQLRGQSIGIEARAIDLEGSLQLRVKGGEPARTNERVPVMAAYSDIGEPGPFVPRVQILLHVNDDGFMNELEIYKDDGTEIKRPAIIEELDVDGPPYI